MPNNSFRLTHMVSHGKTDISHQTFMFEMKIKRHDYQMESACREKVISGLKSISC